MPWTPRSFAERHNKHLKGKGARMASKIADDVLAKTGDEGKAIRIANGVVKKRGYATGGLVGEMDRAFTAATKGNYRLRTGRR